MSHTHTNTYDICQYDYGAATVENGFSNIKMKINKNKNKIGKAVIILRKKV